MVARRGFGLVEVVIAALLVSGGLLTLGAAAVAARARMAATAADEAAVRVAAELLDSLRTEPAPAPGTLERERVHAAWAVTDEHITLTVRFAGGLHGERERSYRIRSASLVPRREAAP